jgi:adenylate cyclase
MDELQHRPQIMVVDDDPDVVSILARHVQREGYAAIKVMSGPDCLRILRERTVDLILLDLMMPEMDGFEFLTQLRRDPKHQATPVIIVTAADLSAEDRRRLDGGVSHILEKEAYARDALLEQIRQLVANYAETMKLTGTGG